MSRFLIFLQASGLLFTLSCSGAGPPAASAIGGAADWHRPDFVLGAMSEPAEQVFGKLTDVAVAGRRIYVLDGMAAVVRLFDDGRFVGEVGGEGDGPGELRNPLSVAVTPGGRVYVGQLNHTMEVYPAIPLENVADRSEQVRIDVAARGLCVSDSMLTVHGAFPGHDAILWHYGTAGTLRRSFGELPTEGSMLRRVATALGTIACMPSGLTAYVADSVVTAFGPSGSVAWKRAVPDFIPVEIRNTANGGYSVRAPEGGWTQVVTLVPWNTKSLLLQVAFNTRESRAAGRPWERLTSYELDAATGTLQEIPADMPRIVGVSDQQIVAAEDDPYPRLLVWRRGT